MHLQKKCDPDCACPLATLVIKVLLAAWTAWFTSSSRSNVVWSFVVIYYSLDVVHALPVVYIDSRQKPASAMPAAAGGRAAPATAFVLHFLVPLDLVITEGFTEHSHNCCPHNCLPI